MGLTLWGMPLNKLCCEKIGIWVEAFSDKWILIGGNSSRLLRSPPKSDPDRRIWLNLIRLGRTWVDSVEFGWTRRGPILMIITWDDGFWGTFSIEPIY